MRLFFLFIALNFIGNHVIAQRLDTNLITLFEEGSVKYYKTKDNGLFGLVNQKEQIVVPHRYSHISNLTGSLIRVEHPSKGYGLLDRNFQKIIPCQYHSLESLKWWQINDILPSRVYLPNRNFS